LHKKAIPENTDQALLWSSFFTKTPYTAFSNPNSCFIIFRKQNNPHQGQGLGWQTEPAKGAHVLPKAIITPPPVVQLITTGLRLKANIGPLGHCVGAQRLPGLGAQTVCTAYGTPAVVRQRTATGLKFS
jgi:hypothetical protein